MSRMYGIYAGMKKHTFVDNFSYSYSRSNWPMPPTANINQHNQRLWRQLCFVLRLLKKEIKTLELVGGYQKKSFITICYKTYCNSYITNWGGLSPSCGMAGARTTMVQWTPAYLVSPESSCHWRCGKWTKIYGLFWWGQRCSLPLISSWCASEFLVAIKYLCLSVRFLCSVSFLDAQGKRNEIFFHWEEIRKSRDNVII